MTTNDNAAAPGALITGVILAGGQARRMGGIDKGLVEFRGRSMAEWVLEALRPQLHEILINANRSHEAYAALGVPVVADERGGYQGPLAGMATAMTAVSTEWILTVPCDSPFVPSDLVGRLWAHAASADIVTAHDGERLQPVFSLMRVELRQSLLDFLDAGERKIDRWFAGHRHTTADFSDSKDTFINVNTPEELARLDTPDRHSP